MFNNHNGHNDIRIGSIKPMPGKAPLYKRGVYNKPNIIVIVSFVYCYSF